MMVDMIDNAATLLSATIDWLDEGNRDAPLLTSPELAPLYRAPGLTSELLLLSYLLLGHYADERGMDRRAALQEALREFRERSGDES